MSDEKPLHIRVAEALGWTEVKAMEMSPMGVQWFGKPPVGHGGLFVGDIDHANRVVTLTANYGSVSHYDTDWSALGPVIERLGIGFARGLDGRYSAFVGLATFVNDVALEASINDESGGENPRFAVCNLILALHAAGKLPI